MKEARERLNRNSRNSSRPPSSEAAWEKQDKPVDSADGVEPAQETEYGDEAVSELPADADGARQDVAQQSTDEEARKPGKQPGAAGFGRQQTMPVTAQADHFAEFCACCSEPLNVETKKAWTAFETIDLEGRRMKVGPVFA